MQNNNWIGQGVWTGWYIENDKLISPTKQSYSPTDIEPDRYTQADLARALGVSRAAIKDRLNRGTLPPFDGESYWHYETIKHLFS